MKCPKCGGKLTDTLGHFQRQKGQPFPVFVPAEVQKGMIRTSCRSCKKVLGYRPGDLDQKKSESYQ